MLNGRLASDPLSQHSVIDEAKEFELKLSASYNDS